MVYTGHRPIRRTPTVTVKITKDREKKIASPRAMYSPIRPVVRLQHNLVSLCLSLRYIAFVVIVLIFLISWQHKMRRVFYVSMIATVITVFFPTVSASKTSGIRDGRECNDDSSFPMGKRDLGNRQDDFEEAEDFGIRAMNRLYDIQEPKLVELGLVLEENHPARYVAAFNRQLDEAKNLAKVAYAALKGSTKLIEKYGSRNISVSEFQRDPCFSTRRRAGLRERCPRKDIPSCPPASLKYRTADGSCNNREHPWWGSAMSTMQRFIDPVYEDAIQEIRRSIKSGNPLPSARVVSSVIHDDKDVPLASITHMLMQWGQFVDHDMTATAQSRGFNGTFPQCCRGRGTDFQPPELMHPDCLPIVVDPEDDFFGKKGVRCLEFVRSGPAPREDCEFGPREQLSQVTSYLDASMVYSSSAAHSDSLRIFRNGLLQYGKLESRRPVLPRGSQPDDLCRQGSLSTNCFRAGDARLSEQPALTSLHVVFLRLHNRIAVELTALNPHWSDEKIFQEARKIIGAFVQHITYREYLPIVLGPDVMKIFQLQLLRTGYYDGYDPTINPTIANSFSSAAYRFGHSLVGRGFSRFDAQHRLLFDNVTIHGEFSNKFDLHSTGSVDRLLLGLVNQPSQRRDEFITVELTNHLFQFPKFPFGMDLASINIQRGRDHGLPPYVQWREPCGLSPIRSWQDLERVTSLSVARKFRGIYESLDDIDLFSAGLAEKSVHGGLVGPTFACIIAQQFKNLRNGDRFWYENGGNLPNIFTPRQLDQIRRVSFAKILCKTMDTIESIQPFVFLTPDTLRNERVACSDPKLGQLTLDAWIEKKPAEKSVPPMLPTVLHVANDQPKMFGWLKPKPIQTDVNQKNRIVVKRPVGTSTDNVTIIIQNHAVNSPIFITDPSYGWQLSPVTTTTQRYEEFSHSKPTNYPSNRPPVYVPMKLEDPNNPNPPASSSHYDKPSDESWINIGSIDENVNTNWPKPSIHAPSSGFNYQLRTNLKIDDNEFEIPKPFRQNIRKQTSQVAVKVNKINLMMIDKGQEYLDTLGMLADSYFSTDEIPRPMKVGIVGKG